MPILLETIRGVFGADERLAKRKAFKAELTELQSVEAKTQAVLKQLRALNEREQAATATFNESSAKAQADLEAVETEVGELILAASEIPAKLAKKRESAIDAMLAAQSKLDTEVAAIKRLRKDFEKRRTLLGEETSRLGNVRSQLKGNQLANPALLAARFVNGERSFWADKRQRAAERELQAAEEHCATLTRERDNPSNYPRGILVEREPSAAEIEAARELYFWQVEVAAARCESQAAHAEKNEIREEIINE